MKKTSDEFYAELSTLLCSYARDEESKTGFHILAQTTIVKYYNIKRVNIFQIQF